jgi:hypothetical protein
MAREQNEVEAIFDLVDAIFDGNTGHSRSSWRGSCGGDEVPDGALGIATRLRAQGRFPEFPSEIF